MKMIIAIVAVLFGLYLTASWQEPLPMYVGFAVAGFIWIKSSGILGDGISKSQKEWDKLIAGSDYKHFYKNTGIALKSKSRELILQADGKTKTYGLNDVRNWNYSLKTGGLMVGGNIGMAGIGHNMRQTNENKKNSGLFITVKDIDNPEWRIQFPYGKQSTELEVKRWMEILTQNINEA